MASSAITHPEYDSLRVRVGEDGGLLSRLVARFAKAVPVLDEEAIGRPVLDRVGLGALTGCICRLLWSTEASLGSSVGFCLEPDNGACCLVRSGGGQFPGKDVVSEGILGCGRPLLSFT